MFVDVPWLAPDHHEFPPVEHALEDPNGLLAMGGDLSAERLIAAYHQGIFPWYSDNQPILWWSPDPRFVLYPTDFKLSRSLKKSIKNKDFKVTCDVVFEQIISECSKPRPSEATTWLTPQMLKAYVRLHQLGLAHSFEVWQDQQLVGGLYGVSMGKVFCGESMFSLQSDASKVALYALVQHAHRQGIELIDCQVFTEHLLSLGATNMPRAEYIKLLRSGLDHRVAWQAGDVDILIKD